MLFKSFSFSYLAASAVTFIADIFYPSFRQDFKNNNILNNTGHITEQYFKIMKVSLKNIFTSIPFFFFYEKHIEGRDSNSLFVYDFMIWLILTDIFFYIFHRLLHYQGLYHFHKLHHQYKYTYGPGALYSSITEFYLSNILPNLISFEILKLPLEVVENIIVFQTLYTVIISHGGSIITSGGHLKHHLSHKEPYGLFLSDKIFNPIVDQYNIFSTK